MTTVIFYALFFLMMLWTLAMLPFISLDAHQRFQNWLLEAARRIDELLEESTQNKRRKP